MPRIVRRQGMGPFNGVPETLGATSLSVDGMQPLVGGRSRSAAGRRQAERQARLRRRCARPGGGRGRGQLPRDRLGSTPGRGAQREGAKSARLTAIGWPAKGTAVAIMILTSRMKLGRLASDGVERDLLGVATALR